MNRALNAGLVAALSLWALGGCSSTPRASTSEHASDPNALTVLAEIALERGDCRTAAEEYATAAQHGGVQIARRASEVGLTCEHLPAAWSSAQRWRALAPQDADAAATYAAVALKLYKIPEARAAVATLVHAAGAQPDSKPNDAKLAELTAALLEEADAPAVLATLSGTIETKASPADLSLLAELSLDAYDVRRAEGYTHAALAADPGNIPAKRVLARAYVMSGDATAAIATAREVMAADAKQNAFELAEILIALDRREEARQELERLRSAAVSPVEIDLRLAMLAFQSGDLPEAQRRFIALAAHGDAGDGVLLYLADIAARDGDVEAALSGYRQLGNSSVAIAARTRAATLLLKKGDRAGALAQLDDYAVEHPEHSFELTLTKAHLLADHGESAAGIALVAAALERHPQHPALEYDRAVLFERAGEVHESVTTLEQLIVARPGDPVLLNALGYTLADHGQELPRAETLIRRALTITPDNPAVLDSLGWVRFKRGDTPAAMPILERAYGLSHDSDIAAHWGETLWQSGDQAHARRVWAEALARDPEAAVLRDTLTRFLPPSTS